MPTLKTTPPAILRSAWALFHRSGYRDTSLQQIADAAGLGKAGVLHHFGSKAGVMRAVIDFALDWYRENILSIITETDRPFEERLEQFLRRHFDLCQRNGGGGCFFANMILETGTDGRFAEQLRQFHTEWLAATVRLLSEQFSGPEAEDRAYRLFADYQGSVVLFKLYQDPVHLERLMERTLAGLQTPNGLTS